MIVRQLKLKTNKTQTAELERYLWHLTSVYNWAIRKIENNAKGGIYYTQKDFQNILAGTGKQLDLPSHTIQGVLSQAWLSWNRCFKKLAKKPRLKGKRNKFNSIPFPDPIKPAKDNKIGLPGIGKLRFHKQELPEAKIKCGRIVKRASGWYLCLWLGTDHKFPVKETNKAVGIDPGFSSLLTLSDGIKIENPRELRKGQKRYAQALRGKDYKLAARIQEKQANRRSDRNHKISRMLVENYSVIYYSDDSFKSMAKKGKRNGNKGRKRFGKSVVETGLGQLIGMLLYKGRTGGRIVTPVNSKNTTMTCGNCRSLTGPTGLHGLAVRTWECSACGADHDRDINSAKVILKFGAGAALKVGCNG